VEWNFHAGFRRSNAIARISAKSERNHWSLNIPEFEIPARIFKCHSDDVDFQRVLPIFSYETNMFAKTHSNTSENSKHGVPSDL
jgi:hypothetical protein